MSDIIENNPIDNYQEHELHTEYDPHCSTCFAENLLIERSMVGQNWNYPPGINPNLL